MWLQIYKKGAAQRSVTYAQALEGALCYGWIDGQKKSIDAHHWLQRFTPRRVRSLWSRLPVPFRDDCGDAIHHFDGGLVVDGICRTS